MCECAPEAGIIDERECEAEKIEGGVSPCALGGVCAHRKRV